MPPDVRDDREDYALLEGLRNDEAQFGRLDDHLRQFNLFEVLGIVRQEIRHSNLLAFLMSPRESHGMGDSFLREMLEHAASQGEGEVARTLRAALERGLGQIEDVRREWSQIDVLLVDRENRLTIMIENKIDSREHSDQLSRYWEQVESAMPGHRIVGLYLTPDGDPPSDDRYIAISYDFVADALNRVMNSAQVIKPDVLLLLSHYTHLLRRHIVSNSEIAALCRALYAKHQRAFDLILEHRPDRQSVLAERLVDLVERSELLVLDQGHKTVTRFAPTAWQLPALLQGQGWTDSHRMLLFEIHNVPSEISVKLYLGPGPAETREQLHRLALAKPSLFVGARKTLTGTYTMIFRRTLVAKRVLQAAEWEEILAVLEDAWSQFLERDMPALSDEVAAQEWTANALP